jgi:hypothetical protein
MSAELETLLAEREITRVILQYARGVDTLDFERVRDCFHEDARIEYGTTFAGSLDEAMKWLESALPRLQGTLHTFSPPWIDLDLEAGKATCETRTINSALYPPDAEGNSNQNVSGTLYYDRFERRAGRWRLVFRRNAQAWRVNVNDIPDPIPPILAGAGPLR